MNRNTLLLIASLMVTVCCSGQTTGTKDEPGANALPTRIVFTGQLVGIRVELSFANDGKRTLTESHTDVRTGELIDSRTASNYKLTLFAEGDVPYGLATIGGNFDFIPYVIADGKRHVHRLRLEADGKSYDAFHFWRRLAKKDERFRLHVKSAASQEE